MTSLRPIEPVAVADLVPATPTTGQPIFEYVDPRTLYVDGSYQRDVGERGLRQIRKMVEAWDWRRFSPPTCVYGEDADGRTILIVIDGQHRSIAAASNPNVETIPIMVVEAKETAEQAKAFVGTNQDRLAVTSLAMHRAAIAAGDEEAIRVQSVCDKADVRLMPSANVKYEPADCTAIVMVSTIVKRHGAEKAFQMLSVLANADLAPISTPHVKAAELLLTKEEYRDAFDHDDLTREIMSSASSIDKEAKLFAAEHKVPLWRAMAALWFRKVKKRRARQVSDGPAVTGLQPNPVLPVASAKPTSSPSPAVTGSNEEPVPAVKAIPPHLVSLVRPEIAARAQQVVARTREDVTSSIMGDPSPDRSALADWLARREART